jgi:NitT/TauT family transport system substrate-binding protein
MEGERTLAGARFRIPVFIMMMAALCFAVPFLSASRAESAQRPMTRLRAVVLPYVTSGPFFIAREEGFFEEQGLDIEFIQMIFPTTAFGEVARGTIDISQIGTRIGPFNAMARGAEVHIVADKGGFPKGGRGAYSGLVVRKDLLDANGKPDWPRIKGELLSIDPTSFWGFLNERYFQRNGQKYSDFRMEELPVTVLSDAFAKKKVAMATVAEPWLTRFLQEGNVVLCSSDGELAPNAHFSGVCFGPSLLEKNRDAGVRFMVAYLKAIRQYNKGKTTRNLEILSRHTGLGIETLRACTWPALRSDGHVDPSSFVEFQRWCLGKKLADQVIVGKKTWDSSFVDEANRILGKPKP